MRRPPALLQGDGGSAAGRARRAAIARMGLLALSLAVTRKASGATILAVRLWPARDYTRVTVESDEPLQASHFLTETGPPRLVIDIEAFLSSQGNWAYQPRYPVGQGVRLRSAEVFEHDGNSAIYEG